LWARMASKIPRLANVLTGAPLLRNVAKWAAGMPRQRAIPKFASETFRKKFRQRQAPKKDGPVVLLWPDTLNNYFHSETAEAAADVLEAAGFDVRLPRKVLCCGRPLYDFGLLDRAKKLLLEILNSLEYEIASGTPIVVLEPSCASVFRDELLK